MVDEQARIAKEKIAGWLAEDIKGPSGIFLAGYVHRGRYWEFASASFKVAVLGLAAAEMDEDFRASLLLVAGILFLFLEIGVQPYVSNCQAVLQHVEINVHLTFILSIIGSLFVEVQTYPGVVEFIIIVLQIRMAITIPYAAWTNFRQRDARIFLGTVLEFPQLTDNERSRLAAGLGAFLGRSLQESDRLHLGALDDHICGDQPQGSPTMSPTASPTGSPPPEQADGEVEKGETKEKRETVEDDDDEPPPPPPSSDELRIQEKMFLMVYNDFLVKPFKVVGRAQNFVKRNLKPADQEVPRKYKYVRSTKIADLIQVLQQVQGAGQIDARNRTPKTLLQRAKALSIRPKLHSEPQSQSMFQGWAKEAKAKAIPAPKRLQSELLFKQKSRADFASGHELARRSRAPDEDWTPPEWMGKKPDPNKIDTEDYAKMMQLPKDVQLEFANKDPWSLLESPEAKATPRTNSVP
jgi:hypothetical protein